ncbi:MAG: L-threonylcarbamoyladenylate synthase [Rhodothermales bacterium]
MSDILASITTQLTEDPGEAAVFIRNGGIVAFPTETVYGLGGSVFNERAIRSIFAAKERPADNPLIAHISRIEQIHDLAVSIPDTAQILIDSFFPGPLTLIFKRKPEVPKIVSAGLDTIAIRMPALPEAINFIEICGVPVAAPSANRSGRPSPTSWQDVYTDLKGRIPCILKGGLSEVGIESTVVDCSEDTPRLLRAGGISLETLQTVVPEIILAHLPKDGVARSPGMKYRHYAPAAKVHFTDNAGDVPVQPDCAYIGIVSHPFPEQLGLHLSCQTIEEYAHELFRFFRRCDRAGIQHIYCENLEKKGLGLALMDRIEKAVAG